MLKNDSSVLDLRLIHALVDLKPDAPLVFVSSDTTWNGAPHLSFPGALDDVAGAILNLVRLTPSAVLWGWLADPTEDDVYDLAFAIQGIAADAARAPLRMRLLDHDTFEHGVPESALVIEVPHAPAGWAFAVFTG